MDSFVGRKIFMATTGIKRKQAAYEAYQRYRP